MYLYSALLTFGKTYFCRFDDVFCLKPALRAVFHRVLLAIPLKKFSFLKYACNLVLKMGQEKTYFNVAFFSLPLCIGVCVTMT